MNKSRQSMSHTYVMDRNRIDEVIYGTTSVSQPPLERQKKLLPMLIFTIFLSTALLISTLHYRSNNGNLKRDYSLENGSPRELSEGWNYVNNPKKSSSSKKNEIKTIKKASSAASTLAISATASSFSTSTEEFIEQEVSELIAQGQIMKGGTAIIIILDKFNDVESFDHLQTALRTLPFLQGDDPDALSPVLIFHEGQLSHRQKTKFYKSTNRAIAFPLLRDRFIEKSASNSKKKVKNWFLRIANHPAVVNFDSFLKLQTHFCFRSYNDQLPSMLESSLHYHAHYGGLLQNITQEEYNTLTDFIKTFLQRQKITPNNKKMWNYFVSLSSGSIPYFNTYFEISRKEFMREPNVVTWMEAVEKKRWFLLKNHKDYLEGVIQFLTVALFLKDTEIRTTNAVGFYYGNADCAADDVEASIAYLY